jgi:type VI protein secretion system component Hcp
MAGFMYFKDSDVIGEATEGSLLNEKGKQPNGLGPEEYYKGWIRLSRVSQAVKRQIESGTSGTSRSRAGTVMEEVTVEKEVDFSSMALIHACSGGTPFPHVFIHLCTSIVQQNHSSLHPYLEFHLYSVKVTSYEIEAGGSDDGSAPTETLSLNFDKVYWRYWPIGPTPGKENLDPNFVHEPKFSGWDVLRSSYFNG